MKVRITVAPLLLICVVACQSQQTATTNNFNAASSRGVTSKTYRSVGVIEAVDADKRTLKINHEKIEGYMDGMTMDFQTRNPTLLRELKPGDRIEFTLEDTANVVVITDIKKL